MGVVIGFFFSESKSKVYHGSGKAMINAEPPLAALACLLAGCPLIFLSTSRNFPHCTFLMPLSSKVCKYMKRHQRPQMVSIGQEGQTTHQWSGKQTRNIRKQHIFGWIAQGTFLTGLKKNNASKRTSGFPQN